MLINWEIKEKLKIIKNIQIYLNFNNLYYFDVIFK